MDARSLQVLSRFFNLGQHCRNSRALNEEWQRFARAEHEMTCPYCKDSVVEVDAVYCPACDAVHHRECWNANGETCSVFGCKGEPRAGILGCPWCDEIYHHGDRKVCMMCNSELMTPREFVAVLEGTDWSRVRLPEGENPMLAAGYLRSRGISARLEKKAPISMLLALAPDLYVPVDQAAAAHQALEGMRSGYTTCPQCGHVLTVDDKDCSYCNEEREEDDAS